MRKARKQLKFTTGKRSPEEIFTKKMMKQKREFYQRLAKNLFQMIGIKLTTKEIEKVHNIACQLLRRLWTEKTYGLPERNRWSTKKRQRKGLGDDYLHPIDENRYYSPSCLTTLYCWLKIRLVKIINEFLHQFTIETRKDIILFIGEIRLFLKDFYPDLERLRQEIAQIKDLSRGRVIPRRFSKKFEAYKKLSREFLFTIQYEAPRNRKMEGKTKKEEKINLHYDVIQRILIPIMWHKLIDELMIELQNNPERFITSIKSTKTTA